MLGRTANNAYWMARHVERAENMARLLASTYHMSLFPKQNGVDLDEWEAPLRLAGEREQFLSRYGELSAAHVIAHVALDEDNPNSIRANIRRARENARAARQDLTTEVWTSINQTFLELENLSYQRMVEQGFQETFERVKERCHLFRGVVYGTMRRGDAFTFSQLGNFIERADNTARVLAIKWSMLTTNANGTRPIAAEDYYRWVALLRAFSAYKAYREVYSGAIEPQRVVELLVMRDDMPRSLTACIGEVRDILWTFRQDAACTRLADHVHARTQSSRIDCILRSGMARFLNDFLAYNNRLHDEIGREFMLSQ